MTKRLKALSSSDNVRWWVLGMIGLAQLMVVLDVTIVNIALPSAQADLGFSDDDRQWVITAYALSFGSLLLLGGRIGDLFGRKRVFIVGLLGFAAASALGGAAQSFEMLVASRALQGAFGALLAPAALGLLTTTFRDPAERGKAFGIFGAIAGGGAAIGLLLGGILTEYLSWRWTMFVNIGFAIPAATGAAVLLAHQARNTAVKIDIPGAVVATLGLFGLVYGFSSAESDGWGATITVVSLGAAVVLIAAFFAIERRSDRALLPLRVITDRTRGGSYAAIAIAGAGMFGVFLFLTYYMQRTLGFSPVQTGLAFLPMVAFIIATATTASARVLPRTGPRPLVPTGLTLASLAMLYLTRVEVDSTYAGSVLPALIVLGVAFGLIMAPSIASATARVAGHDAGVASALVNTSQQVGGSIGVALLSTVSANAVTAFAAGQAPSQALLAQAAVHGYTTAFWWSAGIFAAGAVITALLLESGAPAHDPHGEPAAGALGASA